MTDIDPRVRFGQVQSGLLTTALAALTRTLAAQHVEVAGKPLLTYTSGERAHLALAVADAAWQVSLALAGELATAGAFYSRLDLDQLGEAIRRDDRLDATNPAGD